MIRRFEEDGTENKAEDLCCICMNCTDKGKLTCFWEKEHPSPTLFVLEETQEEGWECKGFFV
jgi:hypothetical protein